MNMHRKLLVKSLLCLGLASCTTKSADVVDPDVSKYESSLALAGYDPVAYFDGTAQRGSIAHKSTYRGATYYFANDGDRTRFDKDPASFLPAFGGYCAFAVAAKGAKVSANPETFRVQDGRLLLFFNGPFEGQVVDTSKMWDKDPSGMLSKADNNWPSLLTKKP